MDLFGLIIGAWIYPCMVYINTNIGGILMINVTIYTIHGSYGLMALIVFIAINILGSLLNIIPGYPMARIFDNYVYYNNYV